MLYSFQCAPSEVLAVSSAGSVLCSDGVAPVVAAVSLQPANVDPVTNFSDGMALGWGVVAAMAAAWGVVSLRRALMR